MISQENINKYRMEPLLHFHFNSILIRSEMKLEILQLDLMLSEAEFPISDNCLTSSLSKRRHVSVHAQITKLGTIGY